MTVDGKPFAKKTVPHTIPSLMSIDESFDIGSDTRTGVSDASQSPPRSSSAYTASAVALVVFQSCVCFCLSSHTRHSSTATESCATSSNASISVACVSMGARYHHHDISSSRQNIPISSLVTACSRIERRIACAVTGSPKRCSASASWPCDWRASSCSQKRRACDSQ